MAERARDAAACLICKAPAAALAPGSHSRKDAAAHAAVCAVFFHRCVAMCEVTMSAWFQIVGKSCSSSLKDSAQVSWSGKRQGRCQGEFSSPKIRSLVAGAVHTAEHC